ncbi:hypothetical protein OSH08_05370 [Kaistia geumhonensis]|uniref:Endonuclease YncB(Thermonuclease family) n=1 Tax=Kaistia geumhonensis TaxID=410839 RepID=A0ABU0M6A8_9HYPH|nr:hypothetical protein [Kaistia geumhonensis]MCX5478422.1 hypothetical protein [Kaistia geumhonensis]MDQ0516360.1 endonuclease YncB(thermonuclease family) [Kaistia geumhonensis]
MTRTLQIAALLLVAVILAGVVTLVMDGGESVRLGVGAPAPVPPAASASRPSPPETITPSPKVARARPDFGPVVTSPVPEAPDAAPGSLPRMVGGPGISPGPLVTGVLEREAPQAAEPEAAPSGPQWKTFNQVVVIGAGIINLGGRKVQLDGIIVPASGSTCRTAPDEPGFDCAFLSMQALRQRIRARGIECRLDTVEYVGAEPASCRIGQTDLAAWLVEQGWAAPAEDAPDEYRAAEQQARCAGAGIWAGAARPDNCPAQ